MTIAVSPVASWAARPPAGSQARLRLFCFPYAGGGASVFRGWAQQLSASVAVYPVQLPGRESQLNEPAFIRMEPLVRALAQTLLPDLDRPFALFGHSMGALICFELARFLRQHYRLSPIQLFVSAHRAPQLPNPEPAIYQLPEPAFLEKLRRLNGTSEAVLRNAELLALMLPALRADFTICGTYEYMSDAPLDCPITAFGGTQDPLVSHDQIAAWRDQTSSGFSIRAVPGDHFFLHSARSLLLWSVEHDLREQLGQLDRADGT
jgi:medium-chain acyl-[acyl-carrier-protein] hydrolase